MQDLTVSYVQTETIWEDIDQNLAKLDHIIDRLESTPDLIVLSEMFSTGFSLAAPRLAETMTGKAVTWLGEKSKAVSAAIAGSLIVKDEGNYYNRLVCAFPDRTLVTYDKKHLFRYAGEEKVYTAGNRHTDMVIHGWRIRPFICYDLRFPIWTRNLGPSYDLALFSANWPAARASHWQTLLKARAIENQSYIIGVNRIGKDGKGVVYQGDSMVISPGGEILSDSQDRESAPTIVLSHEDLERYRASFPAWMDADDDLGMAFITR